MNKPTTKFLISILAVLISSSVASAELKKGDNTFQAELTKVTIITQFEGNAFFTHFDPNYVIRIKLIDGSSANYAIHSPSKLFGTGYKIGENYNFIITYDSSKDIRYKIRVDNKK